MGVTLVPRLKTEINIFGTSSPMRFHWMNVMIQTQTSVSDYLGNDDMPHAMAQCAAVIDCFQ